MAFTQRQRWLVLGSLLVGTLVLILWPQTEPQAPSEQGEPAKSAEAKPAAGQEPFDPGRAGPGDTGLRIARSSQAGGEIRDLFPEQTWHVPPPPPPPPPPGPPKAPPLPFTYMGKLIQDGDVTVYLTDKEERNLAVKPGDVINGTYRVKSVSPSSITFVYIPMNKQQTLETGRAN